MIQDDPNPTPQHEGPVDKLHEMEARADQKWFAMDKNKRLIIAACFAIVCVLLIIFTRR